MELFITAFTIGLVGSFHCIGMCGPIAFLLPIKSNTIFNKVRSGVLYNVGRILTYVLYGLFFGILGQGISSAGFQQMISILLGVIFILSNLLPSSWINKLNPTSTVGFYISYVKNGLGKLLSSSSFSNLIAVGLLNGLLPCGLVYVAIGGSIATGAYVDGALFMAAFGLGTLPMMFSAALISNFISVSYRNKIRKLIPVFIIILGILFILRGLNLGIPYLSPKINVVKPFVQDCSE